ncbi:MAG: class D sortase [Parasporobacterium sp.]|nr:class D sortase [Parasporobacterium sp.]
MRRSRLSRLLAYIYVPVIFCILGYLILGVALEPVWQTAASAFSMLSSENAPNFDSRLANIFDPDAVTANAVEIHTEVIEEPQESISSYKAVYTENADAAELEGREDVTEKYIRYEYADAPGLAENVQAAYVYARDQKSLEGAEEERIGYMYIMDNPAEGAPAGQKIAYLYAGDLDIGQADEENEVPYSFILDAPLSQAGAQPAASVEANEITTVHMAAPGAGEEELQEIPVEEADDAADTADAASSNGGDIAYIFSNEDDGSITIYHFDSEGSGADGVQEAAPEADAQTEGMPEEGQDSSIVYKKLYSVFTEEEDNRVYQYIHIEDVDYPLSGEQYAQITCDRVGLDCPVFWDDTNEILRYGAGQFLGSKLPGFGRMIVLSGHNNTFFTPLKDMEKDDVIVYHTNYCTYEYTVTDVVVMNENELQDYILKHLLEEHELLVMYTCYPFEVTMGRKTDRQVIIAERTAGYDVKWRGFDEQ